MEDEKVEQTKSPAQILCGSAKSKCIWTCHRS